MEYAKLLPVLWPYLPRIEKAIQTLRAFEQNKDVQEVLALGQELAHVLKDYKI